MVVDWDMDKPELYGIGNSIVLSYDRDGIIMDSVILFIYTNMMTCKEFITNNGGIHLEYFRTGNSILMEIFDRKTNDRISYSKLDYGPCMEIDRLYVW